MATNDFVPVAPGPAPNVVSQAAYLADPAVTTGNVSGVAKSAVVNKSLRQGTTMAAVLAQLIVDVTGQNAVDDGTTATLLANLKTALAGKLINVQIFTVSGTYTATAGTKAVIVEVQGGGGSGAGVTATASGTVFLGNGGAAGGYASSRLTSGFSGTSVVVGTGATATSTAGTSGGQSSFGTILGPGGAGGDRTFFTTFPNSLAPSPGGVGSGGNLVNARGGQGFSLLGCNIGNFFSGNGGASPFGAGGESRVNNSPGQDAISYGTGGSGASAGSAGPLNIGGAGKSGVVIIWEYA